MLMAEGARPITCRSVCTMKLHKVMGYGFCDVEFRNGNCVDARFANDGYLYDKYSFDIQGLIDYLGHVEIDKIITLSHLVHYGCKNGRNTVCLVAVEEAMQWYRVDNPIDLAESESNDVRTSSFSSSLPGHRMMMDIRTGKNIPSCLWTLFQREYSKYCSPEQCEAQRMGQEFALAELASALGFSTVADAVRFAVPAVPQSIKRLAAYLKLFNAVSTVLELRPMVYSYWM